MAWQIVRDLARGDSVRDSRLGHGDSNRERGIPQGRHLWQQRSASRAGVDQAGHSVRGGGEHAISDLGSANGDGTETQAGEHQRGICLANRVRRAAVLDRREGAARRHECPAAGPVNQVCRAGLG
jgi:hypothetical protein